MFGSRFILTGGNDLSRHFLFSTAMRACAFWLIALYWVSFQCVQCYACMLVTFLSLGKALRNRGFIQYQVSEVQTLWSWVIQKLHEIEWSCLL